ncbi:lactonase family protein [Levilactobacillus acidifarinae]|uniref:3-carboxymuconate cyclase n=1 Tax=Levilactobacillus acidifarinae DSM 19394 = JCM 15949 TaxID=1423715 RepID=A0A0R1LEN5_9LACO|nr:lactonase family protein [Levilactobacillus acidifarinae]KRK94021.1 3-carboxymuconate cyclase [Levilactobacillus acidifarinae DSM 19394]GEO69814.1 6-phosphogluconolactonase [Levilactobacillus acidifarinae]
MTEEFYIGTYTKRISRGIYQVSVDKDAAKLTNCEWLASAGSPTYIAKSKAQRLYVINKKETDGQTEGGLIIYDMSDKKPRAIQQVLNPGSSPAYVSVDEARQLVYTANYHTGKVTVYKIAADGSLTQADEITDTDPVGPAPEQADGPHPHYANLTPDGRLVVCDLGTDRVYLYDVADDGKLSAVSHVDLPAGYGPRHIVFDAPKSVAYLVGELSSNVATLTYDEQAGKFTVKQITHVIPDDWTAHNGSAAIRLSSDGRFVYVSNRGNNSITVLKTADDGTLTEIQRIATEGDFPRDFNWTADESLVLVVHQKSDNASLFKRDAETGKLTLAQKDFMVPEGVSVLPA